MKLTIIGTGYVGLVTGACLSDTGNEVIGYDTDANKIAYMHRRSADGDIYFISNQSARPIDTTLSFFTSGRIPELWDPLTGEITEPANWRLTNLRTYVECSLPPSGSIFVVFRRPAKGDFGYITSKKNPARITTLTSSWGVIFDTAYGGPAAPVRFDTLTDWARNPDTAIRYYSGPAVYTTQFQWAKTDGPALLDLGCVHGIATVGVNGIGCGTVWTSNRLDITRALHPGVNHLRIIVTNTWANRLTGDQRLPPDRRRTWTAVPFHSQGKLLPAGLLGPVQLLYRKN